MERMVVMVHGAGGGSWEWQRWCPLFQDARWSVVAAHLVPAEGGIEATRLEDYLRQVRALAQQYCPAVLCGASMGGWLAMKVSEETPAAALVLVNPIPPGGVPGWASQARRFPHLVPWSRDASPEGTQAAMPDADAQTVDAVWRLWRDESGAVMQALWDGAPACPARVPTLVVSGREDQEVPPHISRALAVGLRADLLDLAGVSHVGALLGTRAEQAAAVVLWWLQAVLG